MNKPEYKSLPTLKEFLDGPDSLAVYDSDRELIFRSQASDLKPLIDLLRTDAAKKSRQCLCVYDRYVGRAAALLITRIQPAKVLTGVISEGGTETLATHEIAFEAGRSVKFLKGIAGDDICRWEKMALGKTSDEFWKELQSLPEFAQADGAEK